ncbi:MAG: thymidylate kinase [Clostridia bacterium]|nr:thymidylate kinase [Clostridia bacterium]
MTGKLIVIEGLDGSGKTTQSDLLFEKFTKEGKNPRLLSFPCYDDPSSALIKMYLNGELAPDANQINAYAASVLYTVDRYASYRKDWMNFYLDGGLLIANRYTTSNIVHQMSKLEKDEWDNYIEWLEDNEYNKIGIPRPDMVIYLDMPIEVSQKLMTGRYDGDENKKDIHEKDVNYLKSCRETALHAAEKCGWKVISCAKDGEPLSIEEIHNKISLLFE